MTMLVNVWWMFSLSFSSLPFLLTCQDEWDDSTEVKAWTSLHVSLSFERPQKKFRLCCVKQASLKNISNSNCSLEDFVSLCFFLADRFFQSTLRRKIAIMRSIFFLLLLLCNAEEVDYPLLPQIDPYFILLHFCKRIMKRFVNDIPQKTKMSNSSFCYLWVQVAPVQNRICFLYLSTQQTIIE